jgi:2-(1,2-epoxy-1,2-dihydrophenyl)acetyl-CoA isomerase
MERFETLLVDSRGGVVTVTMNRPHRKNAVTATMMEELLAVFASVAAQRDARALVLTGAGDAFCSGADLGESPVTDGLTSMRRVGDLILALHRLAKPTIAKVGGVAAGMGANMALGCDLIVASDDARFIEIFSKRGMSIDGGGSWLLPRLVGLHRAKELAFFAEPIAAADALAIGLVNRVVPRAELDVVVDEWADRLAAGPTLALSMTKTLLNNAGSVSMQQALEDEARCQIVNAGTSDIVEAMKAFVEKREPKFEGR